MINDRLEAEPVQAAILLICPQMLTLIFTKINVTFKFVEARRKCLIKNLGWSEITVELISNWYCIFNPVGFSFLRCPCLLEQILVALLVGGMLLETGDLVIEYFILSPVCTNPSTTRSPAKAFCIRRLDMSRDFYVISGQELWNNGGRESRASSCHLLDGMGGGGNLTITLTAKTPSGRSSLQDSNRDTNIDISLGVQHHYLFIKFLSPFSKYFSRREQRPALSLFISFTLQTFKLTKNSRKNSALNLKSKLL